MLGHSFLFFFFFVIFEIQSYIAEFYSCSLGSEMSLNITFFFAHNVGQEFGWVPVMFR